MFLENNEKTADRFGIDHRALVATEYDKISVESG